MYWLISEEFSNILKLASFCALKSILGLLLDRKLEFETRPNATRPSSMATIKTKIVNNIQIVGCELVSTNSAVEF